MTAFARAAVTLPQGSIVWEVKSVNSKGLDIRLRLPPGLDAEDGPCRSLIGTVASRGAVQATLALQRSAAQPEVRINVDVLRRLVEAFAAALPAGSAIAPPTGDGLLAVRGVVEIGEGPETSDDTAAVGVAARALLVDTLAAWQGSRREEGAALGDILGAHLAAIAALTEAAERAPGRTPVAVAERLARAVDALAQSSPVLDPARLHQEAILLAARADVREEIDRLRIHGGTAQALLAGGGAIGRRLDFLAQELAREANTLCAKSNDVGLTTIGLDLRTRIEQFREQVQNLE